jgi:hypothetical protein
MVFAVWAAQRLFRQTLLTGSRGCDRPAQEATQAESTPAPLRPAEPIGLDGVHERPLVASQPLVRLELGYRCVYERK